MNTLLAEVTQINAPSRKTDWPGSRIQEARLLLSDLSITAEYGIFGFADQGGDAGARVVDLRLDLDAGLSVPGSLTHAELRGLIAGFASASRNRTAEDFALYLFEGLKANRSIEDMNLTLTVPSLFTGEGCASLTLRG